MKTRIRSTINTLLMAALALTLSPIPAQAAPSPDGFIYGTVTTRSGSSYTGFLRWNTEEAFWDDLFHSSKEELPYKEFVVKAEDDNRDENWWEVFGRKMNVEFGLVKTTRVFIARFGDIASIEVTGSDSAMVTMRSGAVIDVSGYANDVGSEIAVRDSGVGDIKLKWKKIDTIVFKAAPASADPGARRLYGTLTSDSGQFEGFIQWDSQEALSTDRLDGDSDDGRMSIEMGRIASIERRTRKSSSVVLNDGREFVLKGTNDVNSSIRGILVEDARYGRVKLPWSSFQRLVFKSTDESGQGYGTYGKRMALKGAATDSSGAKHQGQLVFDMDESESWEMLNGSRFDIEYNIPFYAITSIAPKGHSAAIVKLKNGEEIRLEDSHDVTSKNDGILIKTAGSKEPTVVSWSDLRIIDFK